MLIFADGAMDPERLQALLEAVRADRVPIAEALQQLRELPFRTLEFAHVDTHRHLRTGFPEVVFGEGKTAEQIADILAELAKGGSTALATRVSAGGRGRRHRPACRRRATFRVPRALVVGPTPAPDRGRGLIAIVSAGTADIPVAEEAALTAELAGNRVHAAVRRRRRGPAPAARAPREIEQAEVIVVVAGMEGALPSVVAGLLARPVIAVPTSVGYGANLGGFAALLSMLNSCAAGIAVVNIDNGFGAGQMAAMLNRKRDL